MKEYVTKALVCLFAAVLLAGTLTGCGATKENAAEKPDKVVIGIMSVPTPQIVAVEKGFFQEAFGKDVELEIVTFSNGKDCVQAMMAGDIDFFYSGCIAVTAAIVNGFEGKIIWIDNSIGTTEAVAVREGSGIETLEDLKGHRVATPFVTTSHYILEYGLRDLRKNGIDTSDIETLDMKADEIYAAWMRGDIDAAAVWDPILSKLENGISIYSGADVAADSYPVTNVCVARDAFAEAYPDLVVKYVEAMEKANQLYKTDEAEVISTLAKGLEISEEDVSVQMEGITWLSGEDQLGDMYFGGSIVDNLLGVANYLYEGGNLTKLATADDIRKGLDSSYIEKMLEK